MAGIAAEENLNVVVNDGVVTITMQAEDVDTYESTSGKSDVYASSEGAMAVGDTGLLLNLTLYRRKKKRR